jgi:myosin protein heavy chain
MELLDRLEKAMREMKAKEERLTSITMASADYETLIKRKEADLADLQVAVDASRGQVEGLKKALRDSDLITETLKKDLSALATSNERLSANSTRVQQELDSLRKLMSAKRDEDVHRREAEASREQELTQLRDQLQTAIKEDRAFRGISHKAQQSFEKDLKDTQADLTKRVAAIKELEAKLSEARSQLEKQTALLSSSAKVTRSLEADLADVRKRLIDRDREYDALVRRKEVSLLK